LLFVVGAFTATGALELKFAAPLLMAAAFLGDPEIKTLQMYVEKINAEGGVLGRKLELVSYDDGGDPNKANASPSA
jgi:branched-chain amino acid transport system substrate-binding protein